MADAEHFGILLEGVEAWNRWRKKHPQLCPDLSGADLRAMNLSGANLS